MATLKIYLDKRSRKKDGSFPLKISLNHKGKTALIGLNLSLMADQWDEKKQRVTNHDNKVFLNKYILQQYTFLTNRLLQLTEDGALKGKDVYQIRDILTTDEEDIKVVEFAECFRQFVASHENPKTRELYNATWKMIEKHNKHAENLHFEDITISWLDNFNIKMAATSPSVNARNIHLRNIRAVFNYALDNEYTTLYPFRRYSIRPVATRKRNLVPLQLLNIFDYKCEPWQQKYVDCFKLSFLLIGINVGDLLELKPDSVVNGRVEFIRKKTHRFYSIKLEPEAKEIINKYRGKRLLLNFAEDCRTYRHFAYRLNECIKSIRKGVTTYYSRHSWATIAASLDIPKETIAAALGHGGKSVTDIYIQFDRKKVDQANRKVIDFVLYDKKGEL